MYVNLICIHLCGAIVFFFLKKETKTVHYNSIFKTGFQSLKLMSQYLNDNNRL